MIKYKARKGNDQEILIVIAIEIESETEKPETFVVMVLEHI